MHIVGLRRNSYRGAVAAAVGAGEAHRCDGKAPLPGAHTHLGIGAEHMYGTEIGGPSGLKAETGKKVCDTEHGYIASRTDLCVIGVNESVTRGCVGGNHAERRRPCLWCRVVSAPVGEHHHFELAAERIGHRCGYYTAHIICLVCTV